MAGDLDEAQNPNDFAAVRVGGAIDGYQVIDSLAEGGMGAIFRAKERESDREVALKTPLPGGRGGSYHHRLQRFLREARLTSRMEHDGVARVRDQGQCDGLPYFTLDIIEGQPLSDRLYEDGVLPVMESLRIVEASARAAHHIHLKGVVHRDLKPANILIRPDGTPVIIDFGLARDALGIDPRITDSGIWLGTPAYISPEQALGEASRVDGRADVYSLGAILFELLTGLPPFGVGRPRTIFRALREGKVRPPSELRAELPECVDEVVLRALSHDTSTRFANAEELANAIADVLASLDGEEFESSSLDRSWETEDSADTVVHGWNDECPGVTSAPDSEISFPDLEDLDTIPEPTLAPKKRRKRGSKGKVASLRRSSKKNRTRNRRSGPQKTRRGRSSNGLRRRDESLEVFGRYLAFGGPLLVALVGLVLLVV